MHSIHQPHLVDCCVSLRDAGERIAVYSPNIKSIQWAVDCCVLIIRFTATHRQWCFNSIQFNWTTSFCLFLLIYCSDTAPPALCVKRLIVMFLGRCRRGSNCIHLNAHLLCTSRPRCTRDVHSHQTISVVLMAKSATTRQLPATEEAHEDVGWLGRWFGGDVEAAGHGFDGWEGWKWGRWAKNLTKNCSCHVSRLKEWHAWDQSLSFLF